jgi:CheY-like chemotaxis protein
MTKIMLVEDDINLREIYEARLLAEGYEIVSAKDGEEALAVAVKEKPDLIISDVMMPKISGFDMLDILRTTPETKDTKVIMMTALSQAEDKQRADRLGADRYLVKSQVTLEDVAKAAREVIDGSASSEPAPALPPSEANAPVTPAPPAEPAAPAAPAEPITPAPPAELDTPDDTPDDAVSKPAEPAPAAAPETSATPPAATPATDTASADPVTSPAPVQPQDSATATAPATPAPTSDTPTPAPDVPVSAPAQTNSPAPAPVATPLVVAPPADPSAPAAPAANSAGTPGLIQPTQPIADIVPTSAPASTSLAPSAGPTIAGKKIVAPLHDLSNTSVNLDALMAKEESSAGVLNETEPTVIHPDTSTE